MFKNILFGKKESKKVSKENHDSNSFEMYSTRYAELIRNQEFSKENLEEIHELQKGMLSIMLNDL